MPDYPSYDKHTLAYEQELKRVAKMDDVPRVPHFAIIQYRRGSAWSPGWDAHDPATTYAYLEQTYYWTTDREVWERVLKAAFEKGPGRDDLLAFEVKGVVKPRVVFQIDLEGS